MDRLTGRGRIFFQSLFYRTEQTLPSEIAQVRVLLALSGIASPPYPLRTVDHVRTLCQYHFLPVHFRNSSWTRNLHTTHSIFGFHTQSDQRQDTTRRACVFSFELFLTNKVILRRKYLGANNVPSLDWFPRNSLSSESTCVDARLSARVRAVYCFSTRQHMHLWCDCLGLIYSRFCPLHLSVVLVSRVVVGDGLEWVLYYTAAQHNK